MPEFKVRITAEAQQFGQVIRNTVNVLNKQLTGVLGSRFAQFFGAGAVTLAAKQTLDYASRFNDAARKLGVGVEFLQEAAFAARQTGASFEVVADALKRLQVAQAAALGRPGGPQAEAFQRLGVSLEDLRSKNPEQLFSAIAASIQRTEPSAKQLSDVLLLMGRTAIDLVPAFREGFSQAQEDARKLGVILKKEVVGNLDEIGDKLDILKAQGTGWLAEWLDKSILILRYTTATPIKAIGEFVRTVAATGDVAKGREAATTPYEELAAERDRIADIMAERARIRRGQEAPEEDNELIKQHVETAKILARLAFEQLTPEAQLNDLYAARAQLLRDIAGAADELKRSQLEAMLGEIDVAIGKGRIKPAAAGGDLSITPIGQDQFARMGLYVTGGTAGLAQSQIGLLRSANIKLDAIKSAIDNNTTATRNILD